MYHIVQLYIEASIFSCNNIDVKTPTQLIFYTPHYALQAAVSKTDYILLKIPKKKQSSSVFLTCEIVEFHTVSYMFKKNFMVNQ